MFTSPSENTTLGPKELSQLEYVTENWEKDTRKNSFESKNGKRGFIIFDPCLFVIMEKEQDEEMSQGEGGGFRHFLETLKN